MPRPPRPLFLPDIVSSPKARAEYAQSHPAIHGPSSSPPPRDAERAPPSPTSTNGAASHRASDATLVSLNSPMTAASTRTSWSVPNAPWSGEPAKTTSPSVDGGLSPSSAHGGERKGWGISLGLGGGETAGKNPRAVWTSAFANTKSWFAAPAEAKGAGPLAQKPQSPKEIKLSPSMISASASVPSLSSRPVSSPCPAATDLPIRASTCSAPDLSRTPRVGSGLRYYTERNPAPAQVRVQIPEPVDLQDHDRPGPRPPSHHDLNTSTLTYTTSKQLPSVPGVAVRAMTPPALDMAALKAAGAGRGENSGPLSPPPTPPIHEQSVPHIRVNSGEDL